MMQTFVNVTANLMGGFRETLILFFYTLAFSLPLGLVIAFGSMSGWAPLRLLTRAFVWVIRGTPLMLQLIIVYYGPGLLWDMAFWGSSIEGRMIAAVAAFVINYACYFSEIYRGGIESIPRGQYEAGQVLGMTKGQIFFRVILLQVVRRILAPMSNEVITLVKDTALARFIGVIELIYIGQKYITASALLWPLFYTGVFYLLFSGLLTLLFRRWENRLRYFAV
jgi:polar amino acid transport system permease protein